MQVEPAHLLAARDGCAPPQGGGEGDADLASRVADTGGKLTRPLEDLVGGGTRAASRDFREEEAGSRPWFGRQRSQQRCLKERSWVHARPTEHERKPLSGLLPRENSSTFDTQG